MDIKRKFNGINKKYLLVILLIIVLGSFLRIYNIGDESFWIDEGSVVMSLRYYNGIEILKNTYFQGNVLPDYYTGTTDLPVYYYTLYYWAKLFSTSEVSLRMYSALFGILSIIFVFFITKELFGKKNAMLSSFLFSLSIPAIVLSQQARGYNIHLFLSLVSTYFLIKSIKGNKNYYWGMYIVSTLIGLYTYMLFEFVLIFHMLYLIFYLTIIKGYSIKSIINNLFKKGIIRKLFHVFLIIALISSPLIARNFKSQDISGSLPESWTTKPSLEKAVEIFMKFSTWIYPSVELRDKIKNRLFFELNLPDLMLVLSVVLTAILSYSMILSMIYSKLMKSKLKNFVFEEKGIIFTLAWFAIPVILVLILAFFTSINLFEHFPHLIHSLPPFVILLSKSMLNIKPKYFRIFLIFFIIINILPLHAYYSNVDQQQWREVAEYMKNKVEDDEAILISIYSGEPIFRYYYGEHDNIYGVKKLDEDLINLLKSNERIWLILSFWKYNDPEGLIQGYVNENYELVKSKNFFDIEVYHYQRSSK